MKKPASGLSARSLTSNEATKLSVINNHLKRSHLHVLLEDELFFAVCGSLRLSRYDQSELQVPSNKEHLLLFLYRH